MHEKCRDPALRWAQAAETHNVDVAIVLIGAWESRDWRFEPTMGSVALGDAPLDERVYSAIDGTMNALANTVST